MLKKYEHDQATGITIMFTIYAAVYGIGMLLWLKIDASKPIVPDRRPRMTIRSCATNDGLAPQLRVRHLCPAARRIRRHAASGCGAPNGARECVFGSAISSAVASADSSTNSCSARRRSAPTGNGMAFPSSNRCCSS